MSSGHSNARGAGHWVSTAVPDTGRFVKDAGPVTHQMCLLGLFLARVQPLGVWCTLYSSALKPSLNTKSTGQSSKADAEPLRMFYNGYTPGNRGEQGHALMGQLGRSVA